MSTDPNEYIQERQQHNMEAREHDIHGTLETFKIEKQEAGKFTIFPPMLVNALAVIGGLAVLWILADLLF